MWSIINTIFAVSEIALIPAGILIYIFRKKSSLPKCIFAAVVFVLNYFIYAVPLIYEQVELGAKKVLIYDLLDCIGLATKQFAGNLEAGVVSDYASVFGEYTYILLGGLALAFLTSVFTAISVFEDKLLNNIRVAKRLSGDYCDIVIGDSADALSYMDSGKKSVLLIDGSRNKDAVLALIQDGYSVLKRRFSAAFLRSIYLNKKTRYNFIFLKGSCSFFEEIDTVLSYLDDEKAKNVHFFFELDEKQIEIVKNQIDAKGKEKNKPYRARISFFSKNELVSRTFVERYPIAKYMPRTFLEEDTSVKQDVKLNVFMLGYGGLSKELYKQLVIGNQLSVFRDGEYRVFPLSYYVYGENPDENEWCIGGLKGTLDELAKKSNEYFPLPEMPYNTQCIRERYYDINVLRDICGRIEEENCFSYVIIDTGDSYRNIEISNLIKLLLNNSTAYHMFVYNESVAVKNDELTTFYGDTKDIMTHDVVVNESLLKLAKKINKVYLKMYLDRDDYTEDELDRMNEEDFASLNYFTAFSNIYLANNLRLKLNLLGLDYKADKKGDDIHLIKEAYGEYTAKDKAYENYFCRSKRNALLSEEHFRWNAYHMLNGHLPMKKKRLSVTYDGGVNKTVKNNVFKKHACITTFGGLSELTDYLLEKAKQVAPIGEINISDFDYYKNDELLLEKATTFLEEEKHSVIRITHKA